MLMNRMRRVNEAVREVLSVAITSDLKDPRVGFVTVTAVDTSPDLRHAHVYVSVLGDEQQREDSLAGPRILARVPAVAGGIRAAPQAHPAARLPLRRERGARSSGSSVCMREEPRSARDARHDDRARGGRCAELRSGEKFLLTTHENPDGDALGSLVAMNEILRALGKDTVMFLSGEEFPLPYEYQRLSARNRLPRAARRRRGAHDRVPRLRQHRPHAGELPRPRRRAHREHRPPPRQHAVRHRQPGGRRRIVARPRSSGI